jgi:hypothetical protein
MESGIPRATRWWSRTGFSLYLRTNDEGNLSSGEWDGIYMNYLEFNEPTCIYIYNIFISTKKCKSTKTI